MLSLLAREPARCNTYYGSPDILSIFLEKIVAFRRGMLISSRRQAAHHTNRSRPPAHFIANWFVADHVVVAISLFKAKINALLFVDKLQSISSRSNFLIISKLLVGLSLFVCVISLFFSLQ